MGGKRYVKLIGDRGVLGPALPMYTAASRRIWVAEMRFHITLNGL